LRKHRTNSVLSCMKTTFKKAFPNRTCPCCGQPATKQFDKGVTKRPPLAYRLRQLLKRRQGKPQERDLRTDPRPKDSIAIMDRAYYERNYRDRGIQVPIHRTVVRVWQGRVYYRRKDDEPVRSCSLSTWRRLNADLVSRAIENIQNHP